jgi:hypothetical protein
MVKINLFIGALNIFIISCIFDPFGSIFHIKDAAFSAILLLFLFGRKGILINIELIKFIFIFLSIPILSILIYYINDGSEPFEGFSLIRSYILILLLIPIVNLKIDLFKILIRCINWLCFAIYLLLIIYILSDDIFNYIVAIGAKNSTMLLGVRNFGEISVLQLYYVTSPLICINVAYYSDQIFSNRYNKKTSVGLLLYNSFALFISGTRSNISIALFLPITIFLFYSKTVKLKLFSILLFFIGIIFFISQSNFFSLNEESNSIKFELLYDYLDIFSNIPALIFGQGLGAYHFWSIKNKFDFVTELTYFDIVRYYGIILAPLLLYCIFLPFNRRYMYFNNRGLLVGYAFFLFICFFNPLFFSSIGMLFYIALMSNIFIKKIYG